MNDTVREFFKFLDVDPDAIASLEKSKIKNANSVNPILFNWAIYKPGYPFKPISIEDIVGHDRRTQGSLVYDLQNYFDRDGDGYYKRSVSLLNINSEELMNKLVNSFMGDPVHVNEYDENVYGIGSNGLHRFHVIKMHYLTELLRDPQAERELRKKYTFPVKVTSLDFTKSYSSYLINSLYPGRFKINGAYDDRGWERIDKIEIIEKSGVQGNNRILSDGELIDFTCASIDNYWKKADEIDREIFIDRIRDSCKYASFRKYYERNLRGYIKAADVEVSNENSSDKNFG